MENKCEQTQYKKICKARFDDIEGKLDRIYDQLFEDNGGKCLQSRVNENTSKIKIVWALIMAVMIATIGVLVKMVFL